MNPTTGRLYVANRGNGTVSVVDVATNALIDRPIADMPASIDQDLQINVTESQHSLNFADHSRSRGFALRPHTPILSLFGQGGIVVWPRGNCALTGAVINNKTPQRWEAAMIALGVACKKNADIPTAAARTLCDKRNRPDGLTKLPEECRPFYDLMQLAKLVPRE